MPFRFILAEKVSFEISTCCCDVTYCDCFRWRTSRRPSCCARMRCCRHCTCLFTRTRRVCTSRPSCVSIPTPQSSAFPSSFTTVASRHVHFPVVPSQHLDAVISLRLQVWLKISLGLYLTLIARTMYSFVHLSAFYASQVVHHRPEIFKGQLDFGTLGVEEKRSMTFTLRNDNPVDVSRFSSCSKFRWPDVINCLFPSNSLHQIWQLVLEEKRCLAQSLMLYCFISCQEHQNPSQISVLANNKKVLGRTEGTDAAWCVLQIIIKEFGANMDNTEVYLLGLEKGNGTTLTRQHDTSKIETNPVSLCFAHPHHFSSCPVQDSPSFQPNQLWNPIEINDMSDLNFSSDFSWC